MSPHVQPKKPKTVHRLSQEWCEARTRCLHVPVMLAAEMNIAHACYPYTCVLPLPSSTRWRALASKGVTDREKMISSDFGEACWGCRPWAAYTWHWGCHALGDRARQARLTGDPSKRVCNLHVWGALILFQKLLVLAWCWSYLATGPNSVRCSWPTRSKTLQKGVGSGYPARPINLCSGWARPKDIGSGSATRPKDIGSGFFCSFLWFKFIFHTIKRK